MMRRLRQTAGAIFLTAGVALSGASANESPDAREAVRAFFAAYYGTEASGLPSSADMVRLSPLMGRALHDAIEKARLVQQEFILQNPGEKPPYCEGDLFSSFFEGPTSFDVGSAVASGDAVVVDLLFEFRDPYAESGDAAAPFRWKDRAVAASEDGRFVVVDVLLSGDWPFASRGEVLELLR